jgi:hypothetical protein
MVGQWFQKSAVVLYVLVTACAFVLTMTKIPLLPIPIVRWSYGMMAPYQGDADWNADFLYEGRLPDGSWATIDADRYYPQQFGERNVRKFLRMYQALGPREHVRKFTELALLLLNHEHKRGQPFTAVRISYEEWPRSPAGYWFLHQPAFVTRTLITQVQ